MQYSTFKDLSLSRLGFGMMRLPTLQNGQIDEDAVAQMVDLAIQKGVNYFDTAYPYHAGMSEIVAGKVLNRFPRDRWYLASKYPGHQYSDSYIPSQIFEEQLRKCKVDYFDFYLLHNVCESCIDVYTDERWDIVNYFVQQRRLGRIRHLGFSSHADYQTLKFFLDRYGDEMEFCQIQLNYLDWTLQHAKDRYELLRQRQMPIWVMEPVRGGRLANLPREASDALHQLNPNCSDASWAFRWLKGLEGVTVILSGMSNLAQMKDNIQTFSVSEPLSNEESAVLMDIAAQMANLIPCTACRYCCDGCPQQLDIPMLLSALNDARFSTNFTVAMRLESLPKDKLPTACIGCGACSQICPQHIDIPALMQEFAQRMPSLPSWKAICIERAEAARKARQ